MKNFKNTYIILIIAILCLSFPGKTEAQQRKTTVVKRTTVKRQLRHRRPIRVRRAAHVLYRHLPGWGKGVRRKGVGYRSITFRGQGFRFHKGAWYRPRGNGFIVARAPFGVRVRVLPLGYRRIVIGSRPHFYYYGTFYVKVEGTNEYEVVSPPLGAEVDALPDGYKVIEANGQEYYKLESTYYEARIDENDKEYYVVIRNPSI